MEMPVNDIRAIVRNIASTFPDQLLPLSAAKHRIAAELDKRNITDKNARDFFEIAVLDTLSGSTQHVMEELTR